MIKKYFSVLLLLVCVGILAACSDENASSNTNSSNPSALTWASGSQGGGWYSMAGGISSLIKEHSDISISTIPGGSMQNMPFIATNEAQLAWMQPPFIMAGINGEEPFKEAYENVSIIGNGFGTNHFHFVVDASLGIDSIDQIFEEEMDIRIAVTPVNNSDEWVFRKVLEFYGTDYDKMKSTGGEVTHGSYQEQTDGIRNGNVDAIFSQLALPAATVTEATVGKEVEILPMSEELIDYLTKFGLEKNSIPAGTYPNAVNGDEEIATASMGNVLTVNSDVDEDTVYEITKIINENVDQLPNIHASLSSYNVENATKSLVADLHPGAEKYYKEVGLIK
jgi:uncharacterized protein